MLCKKDEASKKILPTSRQSECWSNLAQHERNLLAKWRACCFDLAPVTVAGQNPAPKKPWHFF